jgi:hypothetical protein
MRLWSLHPKYLDSKGLVALWRETLLAKHVLEGKTKGYTNHPQLNRFKEMKKPVDAVNEYLSAVYEEAGRRGYNFDREKINWKFSKSNMTVTSNQLAYETKHLLNKLKVRDEIKHKEVKKNKGLEPHPLFKVVEGAVADWEVVSEPVKKSVK